MVVYEYLNLINTLLLITTMLFIISYIVLYQKRERIKERQERIKFTQSAVDRVQDKIERLSNELEKDSIYNRNTIINKYINDDYKTQFVLRSIIGELKKTCDGVINEIYDEEYIKIYLSDSIEYFYKMTSNNLKIKNNEEIYSIELLLKKWGKL